MADLEDFFAKRDKSKSKKKSVVIAGDLLEKKQQAAKKKEKKMLTQSQELYEPLSNIFRKTEEDEDWKDFEEKLEPNLADLRLKNLSLKAKSDVNESEDSHNEVVNDVSSSNLILSDGDNHESPWGRLSSEIVAESLCASQHSEEIIKKENGNERLLVDTAVGGKYIPPSLRKQQEIDKLHASVSSSNNTFQARPLGKVGMKKCVPNISNIVEFPILGNEPKSTTTLQQVESTESSISANRYIPPNIRGTIASSGRR